MQGSIWWDQTNLFGDLQHVLELQWENIKYSQNQQSVGLRHTCLQQSQQQVMKNLITLVKMRFEES